MNLSNLKIALRFSLKTKLYTMLNIAGLALGFAGFVFAYLYINHERSYDRSNPAYDRIYLLGKDLQGERSDLTPVDLGSRIQEALPEIEEMARVNSFPYEVPFNSDQDVFFIKHWVGADASLARMFQIRIEGRELDSIGGQAVYIRKDVAEKLFPSNTEVDQQWVTMGSKETGLPMQLSGIAFKATGLSNIEFECIGFVSDLGGADLQEKAVQTFIQVKEGTDIGQLSAKINELYAEPGEIYLDPLKNLHLNPKHGSNTGYTIVLSLGLLSSVILLLAGINFANLMIVQAQKRSREIAVKKILGISRSRLILQFYMEILVQCVLAAFLALILAQVSIQTLVKNFGYDLSAFQLSGTILFQLFIAVILTSIISALYPSWVLSGSKVLGMLKGNHHPGENQLSFRNALLGFQFVIAFIFISVMFIIHRQMDFVRSSDAGFDTEQVLSVKNLSIFDSTADFRRIRDRMKGVEGVELVSVATSIPGGSAPLIQDFEYAGKVNRFDYISVDFEYFETLGMDLLSGRFFSDGFPADTLNAVVLNETAVKKLNLIEPIGAKLFHDEVALHVVGVVKDSKMLGFEHLVRPTLYSVRNLAHVPKVEIIAKIRGTNMQATLSGLAAQWQSINLRDGDHFIYEFADQKFALLSQKQEQLKDAFSGFTLLIVIVALLGLFSMAAYRIHLRQKEVGIRKVLGASWKEILWLLNAPFLRIIGLAVLIAVPLAWWISGTWLQSFAYKIELKWWYFAFCAFLSLIIAFLTVSFQTIKTIVTKPVRILRQE